ncbi:MAG: insulinase family protein [Bacteroidales bacterium]|nr:insulinase family protein [Bacteroidales bacterium]
MVTYTSQFPNGLRFGFKKAVSPVAYCALTINAGTRDENTSQGGIAHLIEHMLFKGTSKRSARSINNFLEKLGGELNAYTTKEETVIHATVLKEDLPKAIELLHDLVFHSIFPEAELAKEKEVVLEEIKSYKDTPSEQIFDDFEELLFGSHPLSGNILGTPKTVRKISRDDLINFIKLHYRCENMSLSIVADSKAERCEALAKKYFGNTESNDSPGLVPLRTEQIPPGNSGGIHIVSKKSYQAHCVLGGKAYSLYHKNRLPLALLVNVLGGPALNSRLNLILREKHALVYTVDASYTPFSDTGLFTVYFGTDKANLEKSLALITKELNAIKERGLTQLQLKAAKKQLAGQLAISTDNAESQCLNIGKSLLVFKKVEPMEEVMKKINAISSDQIKEVACEIFTDDNLISLIYR